MKRIFCCLALLAAGAFAGPMLALAACPKDFTGKSSCGIDVCAHTDIDGWKLQHAAQTLAGVLDFDGDGAPDNQNIVDKLVEQRAAYVVVSSDQRSGFSRATAAMTPLQSFLMMKWNAAVMDTTRPSRKHSIW